MNYIKTLFLPIAILVLVYSFTNNKAITTVNEETEELTWYTDFQEADKLSKKENKPIFGFFTGSDWCGWCKRLQANVFSKPAFKKWAKENVILLELDFPRRKTLPEHLKQQNYGLAQAFKVRGYPTIWLFTTKIDKETNHVQLNGLGSLGYPSGAETGKEEVKFLADANAILANGKK